MEENQEKTRSKIKSILTVLLMFAAIGLLIVYWFFPFSNFEDAKVMNEVETVNFTQNSNFSMNETSNLLQFYPNLRYTDEEISYIISSSCTLAKKDEMLRAMKILENKTVLDFYSVGGKGLQKGKEEIYISCEDKNIEKGGLFVAGEGGPVKIVRSGKDYIIKKGSVLLIRESKCAEPKIALHELLHALGFDHSENPKNIMYKVSKCYQRMGEEIPNEINKIYSVESLPDLTFESVSCLTHGRYLNFNLTVRNIGLDNSGENSKVNLYVNNQKIKEISLNSLEPGQGTKYVSKNNLIKQLRIDTIKFEIETETREELNESNNEIILSQ